MAINDTNNTIPAEHRLAAGRNFAQRNEKQKDFNPAEEDQIAAVPPGTNTITAATQTALDLKQDLNAKLTTYVGTKIYRALLAQAATTAPTATVLENTLGGTVVWSYVSTGTYRATLAGVFTSAKTLTIISGDSGYILSAARITNDVVQVTAKSDPGTGSDDAMTITSLSITVYP